MAVSMTMTEEKLEDALDEDIKDRYKDSQMSKAGKLAMELAQERKRLLQELSELHAEADQLRPTTPTGTPDWYIKWVGVLSAVSGIFLQSAGLMLEGQFAYFIGAVSWSIVGMYWNDKAVMMGSVIPATATAMAIAQKLLGV